LSGQALTQDRCLRCGHSGLSGPFFEVPSYRPWHIRGRKWVEAYLDGLGSEQREWLLAFFVDRELNLLAVDTIARGSVSDCPLSFRSIFLRGHALSAGGFLLVHNHPSGDPRPSADDIRATRRMAAIARELEFPMLDHFIVAGGEIRGVGEW
jgi:DNA repair protein RadC